MTDAERVALTILAIVNGQLGRTRNITADPLHDYIYRLTTEPGFVDLPPDLSNYEYQSHYCNDNEARRFLGYHKNLDDAALGLSLAIVEHRERGRQEGDYTIGLTAPLDEDGSSTAVTTSLAAAIVSYHLRVMDITAAFH